MGTMLAFLFFNSTEVVFVAFACVRLFSLYANACVSFLCLRVFFCLLLTQISVVALSLAFVRSFHVVLSILSNFYTVTSISFCTFHCFVTEIAKLYHR